MRATNSNNTIFVPGDPPADANQTQRYLRDLEQRLAAVLSLLAAGNYEQTHVAPEKPRLGDVRLADGFDWNPGAGAGFYGYYNSTWNKLG